VFLRLDKNCGPVLDIAACGSGRSATNSVSSGPRVGQSDNIKPPLVTRAAV